MPGFPGVWGTSVIMRQLINTRLLISRPPGPITSRSYSFRIATFFKLDFTSRNGEVPSGAYSNEVHAGFVTRRYHELRQSETSITSFLLCPQVFSVLFINMLPKIGLKGNLNFATSPRSQLQKCRFIHRRLCAKMGWGRLMAGITRRNISSRQGNLHV